MGKRGIKSSTERTQALNEEAQPIFNPNQSNPQVERIGRKAGVDQPGRKQPRGVCTSGTGGPQTSAASGLRSRPGRSGSTRRLRA